MADAPPGLGPEGLARSSRRQTLRLVSLVLWGAVLAIGVFDTVRHPGLNSVITMLAFFLLFGAVNTQMWLQQWAGHRNWRRVMTRLHGSAYVSEHFNLPNRNYLLAELRREMPRARSIATPFTLVQLSLDTVEEIRGRRGDDFADRAIRSLADLLKRTTRNSDFIAHLDGAKFCVVLNECTREQSRIYLQRIPGAIPTSDGRHMFDVPLAARLHEYDMESLYATDVLREVEDSAPLRRREQPRAFSQVA
jgi:diguanylate cyclase (GGDEF)-like protein